MPSCKIHREKEYAEVWIPHQVPSCVWKCKFQGCGNSHYKKKNVSEIEVPHLKLIVQIQNVFQYNISWKTIQRKPTRFVGQNLHLQHVLRIRNIVYGLDWEYMVCDLWSSSAAALSSNLAPKCFGNLVLYWILIQIQMYSKPCGASISWSIYFHYKLRKTGGILWCIEVAIPKFRYSCLNTTAIPMDSNTSRIIPGLQL